MRYFTMGYPLTMNLIVGRVQTQRRSVTCHTGAGRAGWHLEEARLLVGRGLQVLIQVTRCGHVRRRDALRSTWQSLQGKDALQSNFTALRSTSSGDNSPVPV